jgi:hypothetical protein
MIFTKRAGFIDRPGPRNKLMAAMFPGKRAKLLVVDKGWGDAGNACTPPTARYDIL